jgi:hypothetical protein
MSGVVVATIIKSISSGEILALVIAALAAFIAKSEVQVPFSAFLLSLMPVLSSIHFSVFSNA